MANGLAPTPTSVKATVQASSEGGPVEIKLEPVHDAAPPKALPDPAAPPTPPSAPASSVQAPQSAAPSAPPMEEVSGCLPITSCCSCVMYRGFWSI